MLVAATVECLLDVCRGLPGSSEHERVCEARSGPRVAHPSVCLLPEIEMVLMERSKLPELAAALRGRSRMTTDVGEEHTPALDSVQWSR